MISSLFSKHSSVATPNLVSSRISCLTDQLSRPLGSEAEEEEEEEEDEEEAEEEEEEEEQLE